MLGNVHVPLQRGMEQLVARRAHNPKVVGSSPAPATKKKATHCEWLFLFLRHFHFSGW